MKIIIYIVFGVVFLTLFYRIERSKKFMKTGQKAEKQTNKIISVENSGYSVYITDRFTEEDYKSMKPIYMLKYKLKNGVGETYLCRVIKGDGEITLKEARDLILQDLVHCSKEGLLLEKKCFGEQGMTREELEVVAEIESA